MTGSIYTSVERHGNFILHRGYKNGVAFKRKEKFKPTFYIRGNEEDTGYKNLEGNEVNPIVFDSMSDSREFLKQYEGVDNFKIYGTENYVHQFLSDNYRNTEFKDFFKDIKVAYQDIEVSSVEGFPKPDEAKYPVTSITQRINNGNYKVWTTLPYSVMKSVFKDELPIEYIACKDEEELLMLYLKDWEKECPDVITGWNTKLFDTPYLINRVARILPDGWVEKFSPWGQIERNSIKLFNREQVAFDIFGVQQLDYLDLFRKFALSYGPQESYKLDHIANVILGEGKMDYSEFGSLHELFLSDPQKYVDYNIKDTHLIWRFEQETHLIEQCMTLAYRGLVNYDETFGSVNIWDAIIYNYLRKKGIVVPPFVRKNVTAQIKGGWVKEPLIGMHNWVCSFDVNSLYPSLIHQYNISPDAFTGKKINVDFDDLLEGLPHGNDDEETCISALGYQFRTNKKGFMAELVEELYNSRVLTKKKMFEAKNKLQAEGLTDAQKDKLRLEEAYYKSQQMVVKILMNSLYGALANQYFRYYDIRLAESITVTGQLSIRRAENALNAYFNKLLGTKEKDYVAVLDTDSCYVVFDKLVEKYFPKGGDPHKICDFLDKVCKEKVEPVLSGAFGSLADYMGCSLKILTMKREAIASKVIVTSKKHYVMNIYDEEGVRQKEPKIKMTGIDAVKSSTPAVCRTLIKGCLNVIMNRDEETAQKFITVAKKKFLSQKPEDIAKPQGVNNLEEYSDRKNIYKEGCPMHVRAALLYNNMLKKHGVDNKYEVINSGDKIKLIALEEPNPLKENVIAFVNILPEEFGLHEYLDYNTQFEKTFLKSIEDIMNKIGWTTEKENTLEDFFV